MSFASTLNDYYNAIGCTNGELANECGISIASLSRYRRGERTPKAGSAAVRKLACGIASLSAKKNPQAPLDVEEVKDAFETEFSATRMMGMDFHTRLDAIMRLTDLSNAVVARFADIDPSYVSRIRKGQRMPADTQRFVRTVSHLAARVCITQELYDELAKLIESSDLAKEYPEWDMSDESNIAEIIEVWLTGGQIVESDMARMEELLAWCDTTDFSPWLDLGADSEPVERERPASVARFYYGVGGMHAAELDFLNMAASENVRDLSISSDMPLMQLDIGYVFLRKYRRYITEILSAGGHVKMFFNIEQPMEDTIRSLRFWIPLYMSGRVSPYYLQGVNNRLFYHMNYVCDVCALSSEAVIGHEEDGRYYFTTRPEDVEYYKKKMGFVLEHGVSMVEIYRSRDLGRQAMFEAGEAARRVKQRGRRIGADRYQNLLVMSYANNCSVITIPCSGETVSFVIKHPKINYLISRMR